MVFAAPSKGRPPRTVPGAAHLCRKVQWVAPKAHSRDHPVALCDCLRTSTQPRIECRLRPRNAGSRGVSIMTLEK
jgi:hypothetical protein